VRGRDGLVDDAQKLAADVLEVDRITQAPGERGDGCLSVVARAVEAAVDSFLQAPAERGAKSAAAASVDAATATGDENGSTSVSSTTSPPKTAARDAVSSAYEIVRLMIRSISYSRYRRIATPMLTGSATTATKNPLNGLELLAWVAITSPITATAPPLRSHFSCCRSTPVERR
jgi:hypothetical protein